MSDKIYFNTSNRFNFKKQLINATTRLHHTLAPKHAKKTARKLLLTPVRAKPKNESPKDLQVASVQSQYGALTTYSLGQGPVWVLNHGWSGSASQFFPLMEQIAKSGFTALAYDQPAHGQSDGAYGHIPAFVHGLETILDSVDELAGVVSHSMGAAATLECRHAKMQNVPLLLVAPVLNYLENLFGSVARSGYSIKLFTAVVEEIEAEYSYPLNSIDPQAHLKRRASKTIIVHDENDRFASHSVSEQASQSSNNVELVTTQGKGHGRIMSCQETYDAFARLIHSNS
ncbi:esterase [Vibrio sp. qd031]|uniref:alpha/beta fold hydrolase n=1 Tax=Vibrio sp. qd031 TaxID=1603038 RepID=UPI000A0FECD1|nr:alpha/beta fold hydrolase [Vibrio sp. qd031]ORT48693.1 esterase [Vibrio sp. qd031]